MWNQYSSGSCPRWRFANQLISIPLGLELLGGLSRLKSGKSSGNPVSCRYTFNLRSLASSTIRIHVTRHFLRFGEFRGCVKSLACFHETVFQRIEERANPMIGCFRQFSHVRIRLLFDGHRLSLFSALRSPVPARHGPLPADSG